MLNKYFDKIYCINLDESTDRWDNCVKQFELYGIEVERFPAIKVENGVNGLLIGEIGVMRSNYEIIKKAKKLGLKNILILEDDFAFIDDFNNIFEKLTEQIPENWDFLYFGGNHIGGLTYVSENIYRMKHSYALHSFAVKNTMFDTILSTLPNEKVQVDVYYAQMMPFCNAYVFKPHISHQRDGFSFIQNQYKNYEFLK